MKRILLLALALLPSFVSARSRTDILLNDGWTIRSIFRTQRGTKGVPVTLPHTWNAEYEEGRSDRYERGTYVYTRNLEIPEDFAANRYFLYFEGVNSVADVFVQHRSAGSHKGGYTAFCLEITDLLKAGDNLLEVWASNAYRTDVLPLSGDFNVQGGIHRPVHLIITGKDCIDPTFHASPGALILQKSVSDRKAELEIRTFLSVGREALEVRSEVRDAAGKTIGSVSAPAVNGTVSQSLTLDRPHLWNAKEDPYLYSVEISLVDDGKVLDSIVQPLGLRSVGIDKQEGFLLNGKPYDLHGFNRHEDFKGTGSALTMKEYRRDMELVTDAGATALRLAHYPHGEPIYSLCDTAGVVLWSELPMCGPGGYDFTGYLPTVEDNARQVSLEFFYQKHNHPSLCLWGIFNELLVDEGRFVSYGDPAPFVKEMSDRFHSMDPDIVTTCAICVGQDNFCGTVDAVAWNKYFSWRSADVDAAKFLTSAQEQAGATPIGLSEYGSGGSPFQHADPLHYGEYKLPSGYHPEEYQALCHEGYWTAIKDRKDVWCKLVWQFSDMTSCIKSEGDTPGMNDKGMVTYDRATLKDSYFFYKANWNPAPMLHLCSARYTERSYAKTEVRAYTTLGNATLYLNGKKIGKARPDSLHRVVWSIELAPGANTIRVESGDFAETAVWNL